MMSVADFTRRVACTEATALIDVDMSRREVKPTTGTQAP
jgi:hypothetical protein